MSEVEFYSYNTTNFNSIFYNNHWFCLQGLYFHFENFLGLDFWIDIFQLELLSVLIFNLDLMLMVYFIVLIYNFNGNFVKCTSRGFDPAILWSLISTLDHSSTLPIYLHEVKKSIIFQSIALLSFCVKSVDENGTFTYFYWVNIKSLTILFNFIKVHFWLEYLMNSKRSWLWILIFLISRFYKLL